MSDKLTLAQYIDRIPNIPEHYIEGEPDAFTEGWKAGVKDGAEWQKAQYNRILVLAFNAANELDKRGACSLADHIKTELERLQD